MDLHSNQISNQVKISGPLKTILYLIPILIIILIWYKAIKKIIQKEVSLSGKIIHFIVAGLTTLLVLTGLAVIQAIFFTSPI